MSGECGRECPAAGGQHHPAPVPELSTKLLSFIKVFSALMHHHVKLDANFFSLVLAVAIVEVRASSAAVLAATTSVQGLGRSLDSSLDLVARALPHLARAGANIKEAS